MKRCMVSYHYLLRSLKSKKGVLVKGVLHPEMPTFYLFLILRYVYNLNWKHVQLKTKILKKFSRGMRDSTKRPKIRRLCVNDTAKTNKDLRMSYR